MNVYGKISVRPLSALLKVDEILKTETELETPQTTKKKTSASTSKKRIQTHVVVAPQTSISEAKKSRNRFTRKEVPGQMRIDSFYNSASKNYSVPRDERPCTSSIKTFNTGKKCKISPKKPKRRRKALFTTDDDSSTNASEDIKFTRLRKTKVKPECIIDLCLESDNEAVDETKEAEKPQVSKACDLDELRGRATSDTGYETLLKTIDEATTRPEEEDNIQTSDAPMKINVPKSSQDPIKFVKRGTRKSCRNTAKKKKSLMVRQPEESWFEPTVNPNSSCLENEYIPTSPSPSKQTTANHALSTSKKQSSRKVGVLSPSDTNTKPIQNVVAEKPCSVSTTKTTRNSISSSTNTKITKNTPPTPPLSKKTASLLNDVKTEKVFGLPQQTPLEECSFGGDIIDISDDEQENKIEKPTRSKSIQKRRKIITKTPKTGANKKPRPLPPYKIVEGTSFAVDAFRYGDIAGVTHYFLTHFHADHYIGLNKNFSNPLYMSAITARLVRVFIKVDEEFIYEISLNTPITIKGIEVTAIDANHCPGAVMFIFKTREGRCILHTGDFRACPDMESEPIFWNNDIHTIYLDTTYFPKKYAFCSQVESIERGLYYAKEFIEKNVGTRILFVCGSYLIGKERFWSAIAHELKMKVYVEIGRRKALEAIADENLLSLLVDDPFEAHLHVIPMVHLSYFTLVVYIDKYATHFDLIFALRPSGWEKDARPQFRGKVNIVGIEYSEHSSHDELRRFIQYLKPLKVISTVPVGHNNMITPIIPENWYKYEALTGREQRDFQPAITNYFKLNSAQKPEKAAKAEKSATQSKDGYPTEIPEPAKLSEVTKTPKPKDPVPKPNCSINLSNMFISPFEKCDNYEQTMDADDCTEKPNICDAHENDDWLT